MARRCARGKKVLVVYASTMTRTEESDSDQELERQLPFLKGDPVFNVKQIDGLPSHYAQAEALFAAPGADIRHGGNQVFYGRSPNFAPMPDFTRFQNNGAYYGTLAHECTHWMRRPSRLDRDLGGKCFGYQGYAMEELVAELGAAFLYVDLGLKPQIGEEPYLMSTDGCAC